MIPEKMPNLNKLKKSVIIEHFEKMWNASRLLMEQMNSHREDLDNLLKDKNNLGSKINWLEDRIVALSASTAKEHNRLNYERRKANQSWFTKISSYLPRIRKSNIRYALGLSLFFTFVWFFLAFVPQFYTSITIHVMAIVLGILGALFIADKVVVQGFCYLRRLWRRR